MPAKRSTRPCQTCTAPTKSVTRYCHKCRPADALPAITYQGDMVTFAGLNLTRPQARRLADQLHDILDQLDPDMHKEPTTMTAQFDYEPHDVPADSILMCANDDITVSVALSTESKLVPVVTFTDKRLGNIVVALGATATVNLAEQLTALLNSTEQQLAEAVKTIRGDLNG